MKPLYTPLLLVSALLSLQLAKAQSCNATFQEINGYASIEAELLSKPSSWQTRSYSNASGGQAIFYNGSDYFGSPSSASGTEIAFTLKINTPGTYGFMWRNAVGIGNEISEHNDSWLKIEADEFYGVSGSRRIVPVGGGDGPYPQGASGSGFFKIYKSGSTDFSFSTNTSDNQGFQIRADFDQAGTYTIRIRGRSKGHIIDRIVLYRISSVSQSDAQSLQRANTNCSGSTGGGTTGGGGSTGGDTGGGSTGGDTGGGSTGGGNTGGSQAQINSIQLVNASTNNAIQTLSNGATVTVANLSTQSLGLVVNTTPSSGISVNINLSGPLNVSRTESVVPYSLFGDVGTNINGQILPPGNYTVTASISGGPSQTISFTLTGGTSGGGDTGGDDTGGGNTGGSNTGAGNFSLYNAITDAKILDITNGSTISTAQATDINIAAIISQSGVKSVRLILTGPVTASRVEGVAPYALFGDVSGNFEAATLTPGSYTLSAEGFSGSGASGSSVVSFSINFTVGNTGGGNTGGGNTGGGNTGGGNTGAGNFSVYNAATDAMILDLLEGGNITTSQAASVNITANIAQSGVKSVRLVLTGPVSVTRVEGVAPYALFGDESGDFLPGTLTPGSYSLTATGYSGSGASGSTVVTLSVNFTVGGAGKEELEEALVFPNPVTDGNFQVRIPSDMTGEVWYRIINVSGSVVAEGLLAESSRKGESVPMSLPSEFRQEGVYWLVLMSKDKAGTRIVPFAFQR